MKKVFISLGCLAEWYEFSVFLYLAPILAKNFFPNQGWFSIFQIYVLFAVGFIARPIGGILFGYIGDKFGRLVSLRITLFGIITLSLVMALLPTYNQIGIWCVAILLFIRIIQGILVGGEYAGSVVYLYESSATHNKYFNGSIVACVSSGGIMLASLITGIFFKIFSPHFMGTTGWRLVFLCGMPLAIYSFIIRWKTYNSYHVQINNLNPVKNILSSHKLLLFKLIALIWLPATSVYFVFMFLPEYLVNNLQMSEYKVLTNNGLIMLLRIFLIPLIGIMLDRFDPKLLLAGTSLFFIITSVPIFGILSSGLSDNIILVVIIIYSIITAINAALIPALIASLCYKEIRYTLSGLAFNIGFGVLGGIVPVICNGLIKFTRDDYSAALYLMAAGMITFITIIRDMGYAKASRLQDGR